MLRYVPNTLSAFRILLVPLFAVTYFSGSLTAHPKALAIFIIAGITDIIDGYLARRFDLITKVGTVLDPLADKLMQLTAILCLTIDGHIALWITAVLLFQELGMIISGVYMYFREHSTVIPSNKYGKGATVLFALAIFITILVPDSLASKLLIIVALGLKITALTSYIHHYYTDIKPHIPK